MPKFVVIAGDTWTLYHGRTRVITVAVLDTPDVEASALHEALEDFRVNGHKMKETA
jgi:hypothetical protein